MPGRRSKVNNVLFKRGCILCKRSTEDELDFGGLLSTNQIQAHHFCLLLSESITQSGQDNQGIWGFMQSDITRELASSKTKQCFYCKEYGATLGCDRKNCKRKFHLPCGLMNRTQHDMEKFRSYCHAHRKVNNVPTKIRQSIRRYKCLICMEEYKGRVNLELLVWADCCCKDVVLHIKCVKQLALSAGYFTKCPACNNNKEFINTIKKFGVFVPERDASWEIGGNRFGELLVRHNSCDAERCMCPKGRTYKGSGAWKIYLCTLCGSVGSHRSCSKEFETFVCNTCNLGNESVDVTTVDTEIASTSAIKSPSTPSVTLEDDNSVSNEASTSGLNVICISSDSEDDQFNEKEPEAPASQNVQPPQSNFSNKRKQLTDDSATVSRVAKKKTTYLQNRNLRYQHQQVAKKSTTGNKIYCNYLPRKVEHIPDAMQVPSCSTGSSSNNNITGVKLSNSDNVKIKPEKPAVPPNMFESGNFNNIQSIKDMISSMEVVDRDAERGNRYQFFCSGPLILQWPESKKAVEIDNNNEVEFANLPDGIATQKNVPLVKPQKIHTIVIDDSDEENLPESETVFEPKITNVYTEIDLDDYNDYDESRRLSTSGIFENRIRSTTKDTLNCSRSFKRTMKNIVRIDFKPIDSVESQWYSTLC